MKKPRPKGLRCLALIRTSQSGQADKSNPHPVA